ncbi:YfdQ family protein [Yersinia enterocolitica]
MSQLDKTAIQEIYNLTVNSLALDALESSACPAAIIPNQASIHTLEHLQENRYRFRGNMRTTCIDDFVQYSKGYAGEGVRCFIDANEMNACTIFNIGTLENPGHADNRANLQLHKTAPFRALLDIDGKKTRQKTLAEWIEDWSDYLTALDADGNEMNIKQAVSAIRRITIESTRSADFEDQDMSAKRSLMESVEAKSKEVMPAAFVFTCSPYEGLAERQFNMRFSILTSDEPILVTRIIQLETAEEDMAKEFRDLLVAKFEGQSIETFIGTFSA